MAYSEEMKKTILKSQKTLGNQLGRWALHLEFSPGRIAKATGATRQTVYNWISGGQVTQAYRDRVTALINILSTSPSAEAAWKKVTRLYRVAG